MNLNTIWNLGCTLDWQAIAAFSQAIAILCAAGIGSSKINSFLQEKKANHRYDLAVKAYSSCCKGGFILQGFKSSPPIDSFTLKLLGSNRHKFVQYISHTISLRFNEFNSHSIFWEEAQNLSTEVRIILGEENEKPLKSLLKTYHIMQNLFSDILNSSEIILSDKIQVNNETETRNFNIIVYNLVQLFENIETLDFQEELLETIKDEDKKYLFRGKRQLYHLNAQINNSLELAEKTYPNVLKIT
ncbi:hypothetical protein [Desulfovibrio sp. UCD-KL4C]|uniref:hypothetical protein n=1 Tax=Desulfovibrio sp. UCD-KL4C TaxID=2578120 RepID=UPI0025C20095|nr:hypothetical protein [Desulfovibrio sp. UCD-KL4C]